MTAALRPAAFAIPGDIETLTGGYIYERRLLEGLRAAGREVRHLRLGETFPMPTVEDMADAIAQLRGLQPDRALILDGLVFGSIDTDGLASIRAPIVAMIHHPLALESGLTEELRSHLYETERGNLSLVRHILVPSQHTAAILASDYGVQCDRITVVRPGTDRPLGPSAPLDPPLILSVGIQHPRKGHDILLRALAQIKHLDWRAVIVGSAYDATHAAELADLLQALHLEDRVTFTGRVSQHRLDELYRAASVFALATRYEGYGIVFDEALVYGLPIVSCRTGAVPDTVPAEAGLLVPPEAPEEFAMALQALLTDRTRRGALATAAGLAGAALPEWADTANVASERLDRLFDNLGEWAD